jgi:protein TonB
MALTRPRALAPVVQRTDKPFDAQGTLPSGMVLALAVHGLVIAALLLQESTQPATAPSILAVELFDAQPRSATPQPEQRKMPTQRTTPAQRSAPATAPSVPAPAAEPASPSTPAPAAPASHAAAPEPLPVPPRYDAAYLNNPAPTYPPLSRRLGEQGRLLLRVRVSTEGTPLEIRLEQSSGAARLDTAAQAAVARWRFVPARLGDVPREDWVLVPINFSLKE